jgi:CheY-like chemotaxis protein
LSHRQREKGPPERAAALRQHVCAQEPDPMNHENNCILVVDDEPNIRRLLVTYLKKQGYRLHEASNGREALEAMRRGEEDLVLLDLMMPEMSGLEVLEQRAADPELRKVPVIVLTASQGPDMTDALDRGICALLPKPFELHALLAMIGSCLHHEHGAAEPAT